MLDDLSLKRLLFGGDQQLALELLQNVGKKVKASRCGFKFYLPAPCFAFTGKLATYCSASVIKFKGSDLAP